MKIASIIFMLTFCLQADLFSQSIDSLRYKYTNQTIYRFGGVFQKGNERLGFKDLSREFSMSDLGFDLYVKARKQRKTLSLRRLNLKEIRKPLSCLRRNLKLNN